MNQRVISVQGTTRIAEEDYSSKERLVADLAVKYNYPRAKIRFLDMERASVRLANHPYELIPPELREHFRHATLIMQANGYTFTTSENASVQEGLGGLATPYVATARRENGTHLLDLTYEGLQVTDFDQLRLIEIMGKPSLFYFPFKNKSTGEFIPTYLIVNPYENCAYRCKGCSRLPFFRITPHDYDGNIGVIVNAVLGLVNSPQDVRFINIITGSTPNSQSDIQLYRKIINAFDEAGFGHAEYGVYTPNIQLGEDMQTLRDMRIIFFTVTTEVTTPEARRAFYPPSDAKGQLTFDQLIQIMQRAEAIFPYVNTNIMLGYEPADLLKANLERLVHETEKVTVNHFIPRIFLRTQLEIIHPTARNLEYFIDMCAFVERDINPRRTSFQSFFDERFGIPKFELRFKS